MLSKKLIAVLDCSKCASDMSGGEMRVNVLWLCPPFAMAVPTVCCLLLWMPHWTWTPAVLQPNIAHFKFHMVLYIIMVPSYLLLHSLCLFVCFKQWLSQLWYQKKSEIEIIQVINIRWLMF